MSVETIKKEMLTMSQEELSSLMRWGRNTLSKLSSTATFSVGQKVIVVQKTKRREGVILKMNTKKALVEMPWQGRIASVSVPYSMLEAA